MTVDGAEQTNRRAGPERLSPATRSGSFAPLCPPSRCAAESAFGELLILDVVPAESDPDTRLSLAHAEDVTRALRGALLHHAIDPPPAVLSGHSSDGNRLERPHAAFLALPSLESSDAPGGIAAVAIALPRDIDADDYQAILLAAGRWERSGLRLLLGRLGSLQLARAKTAPPPSAPDSATWMRPSRRWASVTPVALPRNPGNLSAADPNGRAKAEARAQEIVADACQHIGLPRPTAVQTLRRSAFPSGPPARSFTPYPRLGSGFKRVCVHVDVEFGEAVAGPVLIGAGRYFGVGLCGVLDDDSRDEHGQCRRE